MAEQKQRQKQSGANTILRAFPMAHSLWQQKVPRVGTTLECISIRGTIVLVQELNGGGWNVYTPTTASGRIDETLDTLAKVCGVVLRHGTLVERLERRRS